MSSMLFDSCVNCTRPEGKCVRETLREISEILQSSRGLPTMGLFPGFLQRTVNLAGQQVFTGLDR